MRTVGVRLTAEGAPFRADIRADTKAVSDLDDQLDDLGATGKVAEKAIGDVGDEAKRTAKDLKDLDGQIDRTRREVQRLATEFVRTKDATIAGQLNENRSVLRDLVQLRREITSLDDEGPKVAQGFMRSLVGGVRALGPELQASIGQVLVAGAVVAAPLMGATISGAVTAALAGGAVAAGIALAARDPRVKAAGALLKEQLLGQLEGAASVFIEPVLVAIERVRRMLAANQGLFDRFFGAGAKHVAGFTTALMGLVENALPGIVRGVERAGPVVDQLARDLPELGRAFSDAFDIITGGSEQGAQALHDLLFVIESTIVGTAGLIRALTEIYGWARKLGLTGLVSTLADFAGVTGEAGDQAEVAAPKVAAVGAAADSAAPKVRALEDALGDAVSQLMGVDRATLEYERSLDDMAESLREGKRTLSASTEVGREHREAVLRQVEAIASLRQANIRSGMSASTANGIYDRQIGKLRGVMRQAGFTEGQIDALIAKYDKMPAAKKTDVSAPGAAKATGQVTDYNFQIGRIPPSKSTTVNVNTAEANRRIDALNRKIQGLYIRPTYVQRWGGVTEHRALGGITEHAQSGLLREASIFSPVSPARYAFAEPATGGEAFIPMRGDMERSRAIWEYVGRQWLGMLPRGGDGSSMAAASHTTTNTFNLYNSEATVARIAAHQREIAIRERVGRPR